MSSINPWMILAVIALLVATNMFSYFEGRSGGKKDVYAEWDKANKIATEKKLDVKVKQDVIQNAPIDTGVTTRRLRSATF